MVYKMTKMHKVQIDLSVIGFVRAEKAAQTVVKVVDQMGNGPIVLRPVFTERRGEIEVYQFRLETEHEAPQSLVGLVSVCLATLVQYQRDHERPLSSKSTPEK
jgi:hypothetical protein